MIDLTGAEHSNETTDDMIDSHRVLLSMMVV